MSVAIDANVALLHLGGRLAEPLPPGPWLVSVITELELLAYEGLDTESEAQIRVFLSATQIVDLYSEIKATAVDLRRRHRLKLPDAIIAATAMTLEVELLTNDGQLLKVPHLRARSIPVRP